jgi:spermidine/putrescine transport system substrate-binding protein
MNGSPLALAVIAASAALALACSGKKQEPARAGQAAAPAPAPTAGPCELNLLIWSEHMDPEIIKAFEQKHAYDPGNRYSAAYRWGTVGIYLRRTPDQPVDETWGLLFDPKLSRQAGAFLMIDSIREMIGSALKYKGYSVNSTDPQQLQEIGKLLAEAKRRSQGFEGGVGGKNKVLARAVDAAVVYNGDAVKGTRDDPETYYFVPREGGVIWVDNLAIPAKAPHRNVAEKFIDFILDPKIGAQLSDFNQYATPNRAARALVNAEDAKNPATYPSPEMMEKLEFVGDLGDQHRLHDEIWTQVKSR